MNWEDYVKEVNVRFGSKLHHDRMAELRSLKQLGSVQIYLNKFEELLNRVNLAEDYIVSFS